MKTPKFYETLNTELEQIIADGSNRFIMEKLKEDAHKKGYALLIWFLKFYGQKPHNKSLSPMARGIMPVTLFFRTTTPVAMKYIMWCNRNGRWLLMQLNQ